MCNPLDEKTSFFSRGLEKGWSLARIERAWSAHQYQRGRADAEVLTAPAEPKPVTAGGKARVIGGHSPLCGTVIDVLSIDGIEAWIKVREGHRETISLRHLGGL